MARSFNSIPYPSGVNTNRYFVKDVKPCKAFDMYGYKVGWSCFLKIRLFSPAHVHKCASLLIDGLVVPGKSLQPYESHIPYILAFLADYDLYGCGWMEFGASCERPHADRTAQSGSIELDVDVKSIANRGRISHSGRHTTEREALYPGVTLSSLSEIRASDAEWRQNSGFPAWNSLNIQPKPQELSRNWGWELAEENAAKLARLIEETRKVDGRDSTKNCSAIASENYSRKLTDVSNCNDNGNGITKYNASHIVSDNGSNDDNARNHTKGVGNDNSNAHVSEQKFIDSLPTAAMLVPSDMHSPELLPREFESSELESSIPLPPPNSAETEPHIPPQFSVEATDSSFLMDQMHIEDPPDIERSAKLASLILESEFPHTQSDVYSRYFTNAANLQFQHNSPSTADVSDTYGVVRTVQPHYSNQADAPAFPFLYGGEEYHVKSLEPKDLPIFELTIDPSYPKLQTWIIYEGEVENSEGGFRLEFGKPSPSTNDVKNWVRERHKFKPPTSAPSTGGNYQMVSLDSPEVRESDMSICIVEVHVDTRPGKAPNTSEDPISAVFWRFEGADPSLNAGVITSSSLKLDRPMDLMVVDTELQMIDELIKLVAHFNPDILCGYEINSSSWGYMRARYQLLNEDKEDTFYMKLGRVSTKASNIEVSNIDAAELVRGRHMLNLWNVMRKEATLSKYNLEYVVYNALHERTPHYSHDTLRTWWNSGEMLSKNAVCQYWNNRVNLVFRLLAHFEIINRTCEKSRIIGIDFMSSLTRGSQFQVESIMCKLTKKENFLLISPSKSQVSRQNALEHIQLVMEPKSAFYTDPVCVLDFRSLYPSIIIAFNLCYSTCIGKVDSGMARNRLGIKDDHRLQPGILSSIGKENIYVAPNGVGYVSPNVRKSLLAEMLSEILDTRFMINDTRKKIDDGNRRTERNLNNKQLALKFIANVTYGYTSASFSGRMPCAELADSIVLAGKEILRWCIQETEAVRKWGIQPEVVYGDTDSMFVKLPGVSVQQAFRIGSEIADMITAKTPEPIFLKLEKVYSPSILLTKKRYVGRAFENEHALSLYRFDAKGIETIRRDGTPIVQRIEKRSLEILFDTRDLSKVKQYLQNKWRQIINGKVRLQDFCFSREVKLGSYKNSDNDLAHLPGGAVVSLKAMKTGERAAPQYKERVSFVVVAGPHGSLITERVVSPEEFIRSGGTLAIDVEYYIRKVIIPPLERLFNLLGVNVEDWYNKMPRVVRADMLSIGSGFVHSNLCVACGETPRATRLLCSACNANEPHAQYTLNYRSHAQEQELAAATITCRLCSGHVPLMAEHPCESTECPIYYDRMDMSKMLAATQSALRSL